MDVHACFPCGSDSKESACNEEAQVQSLGREGPLEEGMAILAWKIPMDRGTGYSPWGHKGSDKTETLSPAHVC